MWIIQFTSQPNIYLLSSLEVSCSSGKIGGQRYLVGGPPITCKTDKHLPVRTRLVFIPCLG